MLRRLRALDRLDRLDAGLAPPRRRRRTGGRGLHNVVVTTVTLVVLGVLVVVFAPDLVPVAVYRRLGWAPPGVSALGPAGLQSYRFAAHQRGDVNDPVAYDRCRAIHVVYNPANAPAVGEELTREAMDTVSRATGLRLVLDGRSTRRPSLATPRGLLPGARTPALVSFAAPREVPELAGEVAGLGGSAQVSDGRGHSHYVTGQVTIDAADFRDILSGTSGREQARALLMHELGHLVGLAHVHNPDQLMNAENVGRIGFGGGDLAGLAALGHGRCS